jgi:hypothetical protein
MKRLAVGICALLLAGSLVSPALGGPNPLSEASRVVTGKQIRNSSITGQDVKNRSLTARDFRGSVRGPEGPRGPAGPQGPPGPVALGGITRVENTAILAPGDINSVSVSCPAGQGLVSGGFSGIAADGEIFFADSFGSRTSWSVGLDNFDSTVEGDVTAIAFCAPAGQAVVAARSTGWRKRVRAAVAEQRAARLR